ncbi:MAG: polyribonucleotide nucleotidyltransferase [Lentisphaeraceae bacterium]|nr:polyribonucleotide nucleotidyltransferase [Lentisphaeraceae bacterium]
MSIGSVTIDMGQGLPITIETGKIALLAGGSVTVQQGDSVVLCTACSGGVRPGMDFFPLQVSYREKYTATGRFPGGYLKREGRPTEHEVLTSRMTDRPIRPLFPKGFYNEVQVQCLVLSADSVHQTDVLAMLGSSAALALSDLPFAGPLGSLRVGKIDGEFVANPTFEQMEKSSLELIYSGLADKMIMIEGDCDELNEDEFHEALVFANEKVKLQLDAISGFISEFAKPKKEYEVSAVAEDALEAVKAAVDQEKLDAACLVNDKAGRGVALDAVYEDLRAKIEGFDEEREADLKTAFGKVNSGNIRRLILEEGKRSDGRGAEDLRPISCETSVLPVVHGSSLFARGETQGVVIVALGSADGAQSQDSMIGDSKKNFYLHYNFPNYSVGECGRIMGPGNREIGHGNLAERSVAKMMPDDCAYSVRVSSEIMGSNGSTSMASICGASMALMDAGIKLKKQVAGISCGLVTGSDKYVMLTDILGSEDHYGDMDFKIAGTRDGITGFQLDLKIDGITMDQAKEAIANLKASRMKILDIMDASISEPRAEVNPNAPRMHVVNINPEKIGAVIGTGGKVIKGIVEETGAKIDIEDDGKVTIFANNAESLNAALGHVENLTNEVEVGKIYQGLVNGVKDFGAFVEIFSQSGLLHISEMADYRVEKVEDICNVGEKVTVKVIDIDDRGRIRLSRKAALEEMED